MDNLFATSSILHSIKISPVKENGGGSVRQTQFPVTINKIKPLRCVLL